MGFKHNLEVKIRQARGGHAMRVVLVRVQEDMTELEAEQWFRILQAIEDDAELAGRRKAEKEAKQTGFRP